MMKHFKSYQQDSALLFQFIYFECLSSYRELHFFVNYTQDLTLEKTSAALTKLTGSGSRVVSWRAQDGLLTKLKHHCTRFSQVSEIQNRSDLYPYADKAWLLCLECYHPHALISQHLIEAFQHIQQLANELKKMIFEFKHNENVLFFLLQHQAQLETMHHTYFVKESVHQLFPDGTALEFLLNRYRQRGFSHLAPLITKLITNL